MTVENFQLFSLHDNEHILLMLETLNDIMHEMYTKVLQEEWDIFEELANGCITLIQKIRKMEKKQLNLSHEQRKKKVDLILDFLTIENQLSEYLSQTHHAKHRALELFETLKSIKRQ